MATLESIRFLNNQLVWQPSIVGRDGKDIGVLELFVSESPHEEEKALTLLLRGVEVQGADLQRTLTKEALRLRHEASDLSDALRQSRSTREAVLNGQRLQSVMLLLRTLESYQSFYTK